ncbi:MAG: LytR C-terminal domain-containing protein [Candidatus Latescibacterota bacterium]
MQERFLWLLAALAGVVLLLAATGRHLAQAPGDSVTAGGAAVPEPVQRSIPPPSVPIRVEVLNGCGAPNVAAQLTRRARTLGLDVIDEGNAEGFSFLESMVIDRRGNMDRARAVASALGIPNCIQQVSNDPSRLAEVSVVIGRDHERLHLLGPVGGPEEGKERRSP